MGQGGGRLRRSASLLLALACCASVLIAAVNSDGRPLSRSETNDGGAWLLKRDAGVVGHVNRAAGEVTGVVRVAEVGADYDVDQGADTIVVHDRVTGTINLVDGSAFLVGGTMSVPVDTTAHALDDGAVVVSPERVWRMSRDQLASTSDVGGVEPLLELAGPARSIVGRDGLVAVHDSEAAELHRWTSDGDASVVELPNATGASDDLTLLGDTAVLLTDDGDVLAVEGDDVRALDTPADSGWVLQQPSAAYGAFVAVAEDGTAHLVDLDSGDAEVLLAVGAAPLAPIVHDGCVFAVGTATGTFTRACGEDVFTSELEGAGPQLRLRLVNGWVWINDADTGFAWVVDRQGDLERIDAWDEALADVEDQQDPETGADGHAEERVNPDSPDVELRRADAPLDDDGPNQPPIARDDEFATRADQPLVADVMHNDEDPNGDVLVVESVEPVDDRGAEIVITPDRQAVQVTPAAGSMETITFRYAISDGRGGSDSANVRVEVVDADSNRPPEPVTDHAIGRPGEPVTIDVLVNDRDPDGDPLTLVGARSDDGEVSFVPDGKVTYTAPADATAGRHLVVYEVADDLGASAEGRLYVTIVPGGGNQPPDARNDVAVTTLGTPVIMNVLANDYDPDGDPLSVIAEPEQLQPSDPVAISLDADGELRFDPPAVGTFIFRYTVSDGSATDTARIRIDVLEPEDVNRPPVAVRDDITIPRSATRFVDVLANDGDPDGDVIAIVGWSPVDGFEIVQEERGFLITAGGDAPPRTLMRYQISDGVNEPVTGTVVISVTDEDDQIRPPLAQPDTAEVRAGRVSRIDVLRNDRDPNGGELTVLDVSGAPAGVTVAPGPDATDVRVDVGQDVSRSFRLVYDIADEAGNQAASTIDVRVIGADAVNRPPRPGPDTASTLQGVDVVIDVLRNDVDPDGDAIFVESIERQPSNGAASLETDGRIRYRPDPGFVGTDRFTYTVIDTEGARAIGDVAVGVMPRPTENRPPTAVTDRVTVAVGDPVRRIDVLANDRDPDGDVLELVEVGAPSLGSAELREGAVHYTPPSAVTSGSTATSFTYRISDGRGGQARGNVEVTILAERTSVAPIARDDVAGPVLPGQVIDVPVLLNDDASDGHRDRLRLSTDDPRATVRDGHLRITAGNATSQHRYTITDGAGLMASAVVTLIVVQNRAPEVEPFEIETGPGEPVELDLAGQATDADGDPLTFVCCDAVRGGSVVVERSGVGELVVTFRPDADLVGAGGFSYVVDDRQGHAVSASARIVVRGEQNQPPVVEPLEVEVEAGVPTPLDLRSIASDPDGDPLTFELGRLSGPFQVTGSAPRVRIVTDENERGGSGTIAFTVSDSRGASVDGEVQVTVVPRDAPLPEARPDVANTTAGEPVTVRVLDNDLGEELRVVGADGNGDATASVADGGQAVVVTPRSTFSGTTVVTYTITDRLGGPDRQVTGRISVTVVAPPSAPGAPQVSVDSGRASLTWTSPATNGAPITSWEVEHDGGGTVQLGATNSHTWTGLSNGTSYRFRVRATNEAGAGDWGAYSAPVVPNAIPDAPAAPRVTFGDRQLRVDWDTPANDGSAITAYVLEMGGAGSGVQRLDGGGTSYTWSGLSNGQRYQFRVTAVNAAGQSSPSGWSQSEHPLTAPSAPGVPTLDNGPGYLDVTWGAPGDGGDPISGYEVQIDSGSGRIVAVPGARTNYRWGELQNGVDHTFRVRALNRAASPGPWSGWSAPARACDRPGVPGNVTAERGDQRATVRWGAAATNGCDLTGYEISWAGGTRSADAAASTIEIDGLTNGTAYRFEVRAVNQMGHGATSPQTAPVTPAGPPMRNSIRDVTVTGTKQLRVRWDAANPNGSPIQRYELSVNGGGASGVGTGLEHTRTGLTGGTEYCFRIRAVNDVGSSEWSAQSCRRAEDVPAKTPRPSVNNGTRGSLTWNWDAPGNGGASIARYEISRSNGASNVNNGTSRSYTWGSLGDSTTRSIQVRACNTHGCGAWSDSRSGTTQPPPPPPRTVTISKGAQTTVDGCTSASCRFVNVSARNFGGGTNLTIRCINASGTFWTYNRTANGSGASDSSVCVYGLTGTDVWVEVNGVRSNTIRW